MRRIAHLSDLHFGRTDPAAVESLAKDISANPPDLVVISGDLTMRARRSEFIEAKAFLDRLPAPFFAVPGNHDITAYRPIERFVDPYRRWQTYISKVFEPKWQDEEIALIGLNTARSMTLNWNWAHGSVSHQQMARVRSDLEVLPSNLFRILVAHHPFMAPEGADDTRLVARSSLALEMFSRAGANLLLSGHLHLGYRRSYERHVEAERAGEAGPVAESIGPMIVLHASTATSTRLRGHRNAYNLVSIDRGVLTITVREWDGGKWSDAKPSV
jgi:3',5'-cyclic AMP phosphodiesterase CpdA